ncbi:MAG TPA: glycosyl hydrolase family 28 protein [Chitinophagaceae bacterium]|nr:glycosyl hydrolase family 28 protein [Chitinophagaceae bacterium]
MHESLRKYFFTIALCSWFFQCTAKDYPASFFGIYSDGVTLNTRSIQFAIDYIHKEGGGRLVFDVGRFLTGSIHLKSNVTLHLLEGAVIVGSLNPLDYDRQIFTAVVLSDDQQNIGITGKGIIDGQGRQVARNVVDLVHKGLIKDAFRNDRPEVENRPMLVYFRNCTNVLIQKVTMRNSAAWVQTYDQCIRLRIDSITVDSRAFWNNDGLDIVDCDSVVVTNSYLDAADDGICLKSHDASKVCQNVNVRNCVIRSSASAIKFGTASLGGFRNIRITNIRIFDTYRSAIALEAVDGGSISNVEVDSLRVSHTGNLIFLRIGERITGKRGSLNNISFNHVDAEIAANKPDSGYEFEGPIENMPRNISPAVIITGLPGSPVTNVSIKNIQITHPGGGNPQFANVSLNALDSIPENAATYPEFSMFRELPAWAMYIRHAEGIHIGDADLSCLKKDHRTAIVLDDVHHSQFVSFKLKPADSKKRFYQFRSLGNSFK